MTQHHRATFDPREMPDMPHMDTIHVQRNPHVPQPKMTPEREYILCEQAFGLRARGKTYRQMAALLGISVSAAYARAQTFMIAENEHHEHFPSDTRAECESLLRQTVGPVVADAQLGNLASFCALVSYSNTMIKWSKVPNPSRRKLCRRIERLKKYMDEQDPDLSPTRQKQAEMAEMAAKEAGEQTGEHAENIGRTSGEQNQQPVVEQHVATENTKSAPSSSKRPGNGGGSAGINVVLMMILLLAGLKHRLARCWIVAR
ncbi:MAG: hypothetical protein K8T91_01190 [Planctomycetes bacterium]|nr:hypothetical protein [Planctomycetota bacterium]